MKFTKSLFFTFVCLFLPMLFIYQLNGQTPQPIATTVEQATATTVAVDTNLITTVELRKFDFTTPQKAKDTLVWLLTTLLALAFGYVPAIQAWAAKEKNLKGLRIAITLIPVVGIGLLFGFNGDWTKFFTDAIFSILTAGGLAGQIINPVVKSNAQQYDATKFDASKN